MRGPRESGSSFGIIDALARSSGHETVAETLAGRTGDGDALWQNVMLYKDQRPDVEVGVLRPLRRGALMGPPVLQLRLVENDTG